MILVEYKSYFCHFSAHNLSVASHPIPHKTQRPCISCRTAPSSPLCSPTLIYLRSSATPSVLPLWSLCSSDAFEEDQFCKILLKIAVFPTPSGRKACVFLSGCNHLTFVYLLSRPRCVFINRLLYFNVSNVKGLNYQYLHIQSLAFWWKCRPNLTTLPIFFPWRTRSLKDSPCAPNCRPA